MSTSQRPAAHRAHPSRTRGAMPRAPFRHTWVGHSLGCSVARRLWKNRYGSSQRVLSWRLSRRQDPRSGFQAKYGTVEGCAASRTAPPYPGLQATGYRPPCHRLGGGRQACCGGDEIEGGRSVVWSRFFFSPSYTLRHRFAQRHATAGSAARFFSPTPNFGCETKEAGRAPPNPLRVSHTHYAFRLAKTRTWSKENRFERPWSKSTCL
jgi:hypothetical protein